MNEPRLPRRHYKPNIGTNMEPINAPNPHKPNMPKWLQLILIIIFMCFLAWAAKAQEPLDSNHTFEDHLQDTQIGLLEYNWLDFNDTTRFVWIGKEETYIEKLCPILSFVSSDHGSVEINWCYDIDGSNDTIQGNMFININRLTDTILIIFAGDTLLNYYPEPF